jgi:hypothetical protein
MSYFEQEGFVCRFLLRQMKIGKIDMKDVYTLKSAILTI